MPHPVQHTQSVVNTNSYWENVWKSLQWHPVQLKAGQEFLFKRSTNIIKQEHVCIRNSHMAGFDYLLKITSINNIDVIK